MRIRRAIAALALPLLLTGLTACGDDDGSAADPGTASAGESAGEPDDDATDDATDQPEPTETTEAPSEQTTSEAVDPSADWPACGRVWRDEEQLPRGYRGCTDGDEAVPADSRSCSFGRPLVTYADRFWGVPSGVIHQADGPLEDDRRYRSDMASCRA